MITLEEQDIRLGQLALARGWLAFPLLLQSVHESARQRCSLLHYLAMNELLSSEKLASLRADLERPDAQLEDEIRSGHTLLLDHFHHTHNGEPVSESELISQLSLQATLAPPLHYPITSTPLTAHLHPYTGPPESPQRYTLKRLLGKGGMGQVWLAHDHLLRREVALKALRLDDLEHRDVFEEQLRLEAQVTGMLEHPSIIPIYDIGQLDEYGLYYTMRVVREESLEARLKRIRAGEVEEGKLTALVNIVRTALLALQYAHDHGVVHRDLKPENILVGAYGEVFIIDWGVAKIGEKLLDSSLQRFAPTKTRKGTLVGTPHYMAPEQALGENERVDERTDIYAMGVILYEILTLEKVFDADHVLALLFKITEQKPEPPTRRAPHRHIPAELEEICLRALAKPQHERYASAQEMARDLDLFLEGIKERERHEHLAREILEQAAKHRRAYQDAQREYREQSTALHQTQSTTPTWASIAEKEPLWRREQEVDQLRLTVERHFGEAARLYGQALGYVPNYGPARRGLSELYWQRFLRAEESGDEANAIYFEGLVRQYNDGQYNTLLAGLANLSVVSDRKDAIYKIYRYEKGLHRLQAIHQLSSPKPLLNHRLPHGSYLVTVEAPDAIPLRIPLLLQRLEIRHIEVTLREKGSLPPNFIIITAGPYLGGNLEVQSREQSRRVEPEFAIMTYPVTCRAYVDFLNGLVAEGRYEEALSRCPRIKEDADHYFGYEATRGFFIPEEDAEGDAWNPDWPIVLVTYHDAEAYADWRSRRDGLRYSIPTATQFEKAARGVDGRVFAWGNEFDPAFCRMRESEPGRPFPSPVGSYPMDCSPYGVMDLTGNIIEWTSTWDSESAQTKVMRGGSYSSIAQGCRLDWKISSPCHFRYSTYGFRLALAL